MIHTLNTRHEHHYLCPAQVHMDIELFIRVKHPRRMCQICGTKLTPSTKLGDLILQEKQTA